MRFLIRTFIVMKME